MEVKAKREGCYSELKVHFEIANLVSLTKIEKLLIFQFFYSFIKILVKLKFFFCQYEMKHKFKYYCMQKTFIFRLKKITILKNIDS